jgi:lysophospholipase L1-like esterase
VASYGTHLRIAIDDARRFQGKSGPGMLSHSSFERAERESAMVKTIVCFGDSNTWGYDPATNTRFAPDQRWTGVLQASLGTDYRVIEEGLNGRTTTVDDPIYPHRNGRDYLPPCLESHAPFDLVTIMLGTNDLKKRFDRSASDISESAGILAGMAKQSPFGPGGASPAVLLIAPPAVTILTELDEMFDGAVAKSERFARFYRLRAERLGIHFLDAGVVIRCSDLDGIHFEASEHAKLGAAVAEKITGILG